MKNEIVEIHDHEPFTNTLIISEGVGLGHASVIKLVRKYKTDFEEFGPLGFQIHVAKRKQGGGTALEYAELNEDQATFLMTLFRNSQTVLQFKLRLVKAFRKALKELERLNKQSNNQNWKFIRDDTKLGFKWMTENLKEVREAEGKETKPYHYQNEVRMINAVLSNRFAGLDRNALSAEDLRIMGELQRYNARLIAQNLSYQDRKTKILQYFALKLDKPKEQGLMPCNP